MVTVTRPVTADQRRRLLGPSWPFTQGARLRRSKNGGAVLAVSPPGPLVISASVGASCAKREPGWI